MKYPKVLQVLLAASLFTTAAPAAAASVSASGTEVRETPEAYEARTNYELPGGYHYVLDEEKYVVLDENGFPILAKNDESGKSEEHTDSTAGDSGNDGNGNETTENGNGGDGNGNDGGTAEGGDEGTGSDMTENGNGGDGNGGGATEGGGDEGTGSDTTENGNGGDGNGGGATEGGSDEGADSDMTENGNGGDGNGNDTAETDNGKTETDRKEENGNANNGFHNINASSGDSGGEALSKNRAESARIYEEPEISAVERFREQTSILGALDYEASAKFLALGERVRYNVEVPIEGIPSFITQEMIVGALKAQDETGYPASVTIAQIIQESGYGKYGPGGKHGEGLSYLAYQYCNLFGIKGTGTLGSAKLDTFEVSDDGRTYSTQAGFRAYNTYTECIEDRSKLLEEVYSDLTENVTDANTFAVRIGSRWATDPNYAKSLIRIMREYDLYRLDELTLTDFSKMIGRFADPCPGATVTSTFGYRTFDNSFHKGLDLGTGAENIPTYAADAGTVIFAGDANTAGNMVVIDHGDGLVTKYMHHLEIFVEEGQEVEKGQQIGLSGTTGYSTGNHLHFQVEENGKAVDPAKYLTEEGSGEVVKMQDSASASGEKSADSTRTKKIAERRRNRLLADRKK